MLAILAIAGYLVGSIPVAWLVTKALTGKDLRHLGSGNVGVMNVALNVSRRAGLLVFLAEIAKGLLAVTLARALDGGQIGVGLAVLATFVGTRWPIWLRGAGGRGNTVAMTGLLLVSWPAWLGVAAVWSLARRLTHSSFTATRLGLVSWPVVSGLVTQSPWCVLFGTLIALLFLSTHRPETDDHRIVRARWPSLWAFLTARREALACFTTNGL